MELIQKHSMVYPANGQAARCSRRSKKPAAIRTRRDERYGFLNHRFLPLWENPGNRLKNFRVVERDFFNSLSHLANLYSFEPLNVSGEVFPLNIYLSYQHACNCLNEKDPELQLLIIQDDTRLATLATLRKYNTGNTLFYLPVCPLYEWLQEKKQRPKARLLLSVFGYLHRTIAIPFFTDRRTSLNGYYYTIKEWTEGNGDEWDEGEFDRLKKEFKTLFREGKKIHREINKTEHLTEFKKRIDNLPVGSTADKQMKDTCIKFWELSREYPYRSLSQSFYSTLINEDDDQRIYPDEYISFYWSSKGQVYEHLIEYINSSFSERGVTDEPAAIQFFDTPQTRPEHDLAFEERLFDLLHELADILNEDE